MIKNQHTEKIWGIVTVREREIEDANDDATEKYYHIPNTMAHRMLKSTRDAVGSEVYDQYGKPEEHNLGPLCKVVLTQDDFWIEETTV